MSDPMAVSRRLVAVFAADVEGYSRLMGADEVGTLKGLTVRRARQPVTHKRHRPDRNPTGSNLPTAEGVCYRYGSGAGDLSV